MITRLAVPLVLAVILGAGGLRAQVTPTDSLDAARKLYASASYEEALAMLERVKADDPPRGVAARRDLEATRALCLLALGRERESRQAMEAVVFVDPQFEFDERDAAPRVRALLEETRAKRLPQIIRQRYSEARHAYDKGEYEDATARFDAVLVLLEDPILRQADDYEAMQDLAILARDFHALSGRASAAAKALPAPGGQPGVEGGTSAAQPSAADSVGTAGRAPGVPLGTVPSTTSAPGAAPSAGTASPAPASPGPPQVAPAVAASPPIGAGTPPPTASPPPVGSLASQPSGNVAPIGSTPASSIVAPLALEQPVPAWSDELNLEPGRTYQATVEVVIDEGGRVTSARLLDSINPVYDARLVEVVRRWRYRPGTRAGVPVRFTKLVTVTVEAR